MGNDHQLKKKPLDCQTNSPCLHPGERMEKSVEKIDVDVNGVKD